LSYCDFSGGQTFSFFILVFGGVVDQFLPWFLFADGRMWVGFSIF
jgi:hypothetical protein